MVRPGGEARKRKSRELRFTKKQGISTKVNRVAETKRNQGSHKKRTNSSVSVKVQDWKTRGRGIEERAVHEPTN